MSWTNLIDAVAAEAGVPRETARKVLSAWVDVSMAWLREGREVPMRGLGVIGTRWIEGRVVRSVADQRKMYVGGRFSARFRPSVKLRAVLGERADGAWRSPEHQAAWRLAETLIGDLDLYHGAQAPRSLDSRMGAEHVESACSVAFGEPWEQVRATYAQRVPAALVQETHYLGIAARRRWGTA